MAILNVTNDSIIALQKTTMSELKLKERGDLQRLLRASFDVVVKDVLIIAEEFGNWEDSKRRIDLLGLDRDANLVVIELKRTEDGGHMELQAVRYAAMISVLTFDQVVDAHREYLEAAGSSSDARDAILEFLDWDEPNQDLFGQDVRIILLSMDFSKEITTAVLWLNQKGLDIRCIRLTPYQHGKDVFIDVQPIIPLPEAAEFQTKVREKEQQKRASSDGSDLRRFTATLGDTTIPNLPKRRVMLHLFRYLADKGVSPEEIAKKIGSRALDRTTLRFDGMPSSEQIVKLLLSHGNENRNRYHPKHWFTDEQDLIRFKGSTYIVNTRWGRMEKHFGFAAAAFSEFRLKVVPDAVSLVER